MDFPNEKMKIMTNEKIQKMIKMINSKIIEIWN